MSALRFAATDGQPLFGEVIYRRSEYSFDFVPGSRQAVAERVGDESVTSVGIGTLQLELGVETGVILYSWGLHPANRWIPGTGVPRYARPGIVAATIADKDDEGLIMGVTVGLAEVGEWFTVFDEGTGWARVAADHDQADEQQVLIASGTVLGLVGDRLNSVWLHPKFQP